MESDVLDTITIKQLLNNSIINNENFDYIKQMINKNVEDCNLLYTQVCYLIKLFLLYDYENNKNLHNDYIFNEIFVRKCFKLIKTGKIEHDKVEDDKDENNNKLSSNPLIERLVKFYNYYNSNEDNTIKFIRPDNIGSITHITDQLSRDIQTNITNNIKLNYNKYIREYVNINLKLKFSDIDDKIINTIYNDIYSNTFYSDSIYHMWINEHKKLIIPKSIDKIYIENFNDGIDVYIFIKYITKYVKTNQKLKNLIMLNNDGIIINKENKKTTRYNYRIFNW